MYCVKMMDIHGKYFFVEVVEEIPENVLEAIDQENHQTENILHQDKRKKDDRGLEDYILWNNSKDGNGIEPSPEDRHIQQEVFQEIIQVLDNCCTPKQRTRFLLHAIMGLSYQKIGEICGCSKTSVSESIQYVRKKILKKINFF